MRVDLCRHSYSDAVGPTALQPARHWPGGGGRLAVHGRGLVRSPRGPGPVLSFLIAPPQSAVCGHELTLSYSHVISRLFVAFLFSILIVTRSRHLMTPGRCASPAARYHLSWFCWARPPCLCRSPRTSLLQCWPSVCVRLTMRSVNKIYVSIRRPTRTRPICSPSRVHTYQPHFHPPTQHPSLGCFSCAAIHHRINTLMLDMLYMIYMLCMRYIPLTI